MRLNAPTLTWLIPTLLTAAMCLIGWGKFSGRVEALEAAQVKQAESIAKHDDQIRTVDLSARVTLAGILATQQDMQAKLNRIEDHLGVSDTGRPHDGMASR